MSTASADTRLEEATTWFLCARADSACADDLADLRRWMQEDTRNAAAYLQVSVAWNSIGAHASAPQIVAGRRDALQSAHSAGRQWMRGSAVRRYSGIAAALLGVAVVLSVGFWAWLGTRGDVYATDLAERRVVTLQDGSVVSLDARSRMRVRFSEAGRQVMLEAGQAHFDVAKDPARPFSVQARGETVIAVGTQFNVDMVAKAVVITLLEGRVTVVDTAPRARGTKPTMTQIEPGQQLIAREHRPVQVRSDVNVGRATAWQSGKLIFDDEPLATAVERVGRYARRSILVDASVADVAVSGVFNAGDVDAFIEAVTEYFPIDAEDLAGPAVRLVARR